MTNEEIEIRAAELEDASRRAYDGKCPGIASIVERWGWIDHSCQPEAIAEPTIIADYPQWHAGFLAREMRTHAQRDDRDRDAWPWDPTRPVVGQYDEWLMTQRPTVEIPVTKETKEQYDARTGTTRHTVYEPPLSDEVKRQAEDDFNALCDPTGSTVGEP